MRKVSNAWIILSQHTEYSKFGTFGMDPAQPILILLGIHSHLVRSFSNARMGSPLKGLNAIISLHFTWSEAKSGHRTMDTCKQSFWKSLSSSHSFVSAKKTKNFQYGY